MVKKTARKAIYSPKNSSPRGYLSWSQLNLWEKDANLYYQVYCEGLDQFRTRQLELGKKMATTLENGHSEDGDPMLDLMAVFMPSYPAKEFEIKAVFEGIPLKGKLDGFGIKCQSCGSWQDIIGLKNEKQQMDVPALQKERGVYGSTSHQTIRSISKTTFQDKQRLNTLPILSSSCDKCGVEGKLISVIGEFKSGRHYTQSMADDTGQLTMYALLVWLKYKKLPAKILLHWAKTDEDMEGNLFLTGDIKTFKTQRSLSDLILFSKRIRAAWAGICALGEFMKTKWNIQDCQNY